VIELARILTRSPMPLPQALNTRAHASNETRFNNRDVVMLKTSFALDARLTCQPCIRMQTVRPLCKSIAEPRCSANSIEAVAARFSNLPDDTNLNKSFTRLA
jgi:hypothetical protein